MKYYFHKWKTGDWVIVKGDIMYELLPYHRSLKPFEAFKGTLIKAHGCFNDSWYVGSQVKLYIPNNELGNKKMIFGGQIGKIFDDMEELLKGCFCDMLQ